MPDVTVIGDRALKEVLRLNKVIRMGPQSDIRGARDTRDCTCSLFLSPPLPLLLPLPSSFWIPLCSQRKGHEKFYKPRREASPGSNPAGPLILDLQLPEL